MLKLLVTTSMILTAGIYGLSEGADFTATKSTPKASVITPVTAPETIQNIVAVRAVPETPVTMPLTDASYVTFHTPLVTKAAPLTQIVPASYSTQATDPTAGLDVRRVTGDRVNVRAGAGTSYAVVSSALRGDRAEVLQVSGDWAKIQLIDSGETGWMAAWLLTD